MTKRVLLTGGAGFIGSHVLRYLLDARDWEIVLIDRLDGSGNLNRLAEFGIPKETRVKYIYHDLKAPITDQLAHQIGRLDYILHLAAATHVDRSIEDPLSFVMDNVVATCNLLNYARTIPLERFIYFSTDEVFGPAPDGVAFKENDRYRSGNPYAATKAGGEELAVAFHNTYRVPVIVTHTMNVIGVMQHPEKFVPMTISKIRDGEKVMIHSNKDRTKAGSRYYIAARDVAEALLFLLQVGVPGMKYNIVGKKEIDNLQLAQMIAKTMAERLRYEMVDFHSARPGHDLRYALDGGLMRMLGWEPRTSIETELSSIVSWSLLTDKWLMPPKRPALRAAQ